MTSLDGIEELARRSLVEFASASRRRPALAVGATAIGAVAIGALALGAVAIGRLAIGGLVIRHARIDRLSVGHLDLVPAPEDGPRE
jgi:hypothetical protein